jgi:hypothetical protein
MIEVDAILVEHGELSIGITESFRAKPRLFREAKLAATSVFRAYRD